MKKSELGFTYPLTLCLLVIFLLFFSFQMEALLTERRLLHESVTILLEDYYFHSAVQKTEELLQSGKALPETAMIPFTKGIMEYQSKVPAGLSQEVTYTLRLNTGECVTARAVFSLQSNTIIKWVQN